MFVAIHPSYNKSRIVRLIALKSYFFKNPKPGSFLGLCPLGPHQGFCPGPTGGMKVAQYLQRFGPPFNKFWICHCKDFTYLFTVIYCCCLQLNSFEAVLHIHTFLSLPSPVSFKHCYIYKISSLYRALYHLKQCYM